MLAGSFGLDEHTSVIPNVLFMFTEQTWSPQKKKNWNKNEVCLMFL